MLFHRSKPLLFDVGYGPTRKLTELSAHGPPLAKLLERAVRQALELDSPLQASFGAAAAAAVGASIGDVVSAPVHERVGDERPDDAATWNEEATRLARETAGWLSARMAPALERSGEMLQNAEVSGWAALERARERSRRALDTAKQRVLEKVQEQLGAGGEPPPAGGGAGSAATGGGGGGYGTIGGGDGK